MMVGSDDLAAAAAGDPLDLLLARPGQRMAVSAGAAGGLLLRRRADGRLAARRYGAVPAARAVDLTGAGDAFFAGWIAAELTMGAPSDGRALHIAAAAASLKVEGYGLDGLPTTAALRGRLRRVGPART
jgi:sugar/nucleoside kinase (ribokinase family)